MKKDSKHIDNNSFNKLIKDKLDKHKMPVEKDLWSRIESDMRVEKKHRLPVWLWMSISSAAVISLLLLTRSAIYYQNTNSVHPSFTQNGNTPPSIGKTVADETSDKNVQYVGLAKNGAIRTTERTSADISTNISKENTEKQALISKSIRLYPETATNELSKEKKTSIASGDTSNVTHKKAEKRLIENPFIAKTAERKIYKKSKKSDWVLVALLSSGNNTSQNNKVNVATNTTVNNYSTTSNTLPVSITETIVTTTSPTAVITNTTLVTTTYYAAASGEGTPTTSTTTSNSSNIVYKTITTTEPDASLFSDVNYHMPVSVGLKLGKTISKNLSIESGLVYTYLQTDFAGDNVSAEYELNYLGIPINLRYNLWKMRNLYFNISGGVMAEKGLQSTFRFNQIKSTGNVNNTTNASIGGLQWSANAATDVCYTFFPHYSVYCEPQLSYYFDNDQPVSIRTKHPFVFGLQLGLRYDL